MVRIFAGTYIGIRRQTHVSKKAVSAGWKQEALSRIEGQKIETRMKKKGFQSNNWSDDH